MEAAFVDGPAGRRVEPGPGMTLMTASAGDPLPDQGVPVLVLADGTLVVAEVTTRDVEAAAERAQRAMVERFEFHLHVLADRDAPAATIAALVGRIPVQPPDGTNEFGLVVELAGDRVSPPQIPTHYPREATRSKQREWLRHEAVGCDAVRQALDIAAGPYGLTYERSLPRVPNAVRACECAGVDVESITAFMWLSFGKQAPHQRTLALQLTADPSAELVTLPATATARDLLAVVEARPRPFRLVVGAAQP